ncbi:FAD assembly factor SdhE [Parachitinimonas caeni]|uniref:FAD assembly factor SdhE n=1 Tax=Parachitinimonas caeni TaxID=3031301 RepID=A0ABT7DZW1_9NEIS|nr:succinate dehydrogenase assembly factor 2 [Parachitinimonas caeni]MDK2125534.1 succinate dehydrogenase assembly factor 2 [Parachitinimonas caeni]
MDEAEKNRLRWRSRRGLLELDLVFSRFLQHEFDSLSDAEFEIYQDLLLLPDNDLLDLVDGKTESKDERFVPMLARLRSWNNDKKQQ